ncbi:hypothetical protein AB9P05_04620 [Roseivirga sp. BDSF3-8]|uniref:hypothetical protein n=1 Tax=Roseivirga sp. BDSF3-8 TaxID=3241598 RepID=UPI0035323F1E
MEKNAMLLFGYVFLLVSCQPTNISQVEVTLRMIVIDHQVNYEDYLAVEGYNRKPENIRFDFMVSNCCMEEMAIQPGSENSTAKEWSLFACVTNDKDTT